MLVGGARFHVDGMGLPEGISRAVEREEQSPIKVAANNGFESAFPGEFAVGVAVRDAVANRQFSDLVTLLSEELLPTGLPHRAHPGRNREEAFRAVRLSIVRIGSFKNRASHPVAIHFA